MSDPRNLRVDIDHLLARIDALGEIGRIDGPNGEWGNARLALTEADRMGRDLVVTWMRDLGLDVEIDAIGNVVATRQGSDPTRAPVMIGSHIDTVGTGGRFDGVLGVLAGLEVAEGAGCFEGHLWIATAIMSRCALDEAVGAPGPLLLVTKPGGAVMNGHEL